MLKGDQRESYTRRLASQSQSTAAKGFRCTLDSKNGVNHYGCKNNICIDVDHGLIRRYAVTPAHRHDRQMLPRLLDSENEHGSVWADSSYAGESFETLLNLGGFETCILEKGSRNQPISGAAKQRNRVKSAIRACIEHVFGCMTMSTWVARYLERLIWREIKHDGVSRI